MLLTIGDLVEELVVELPSELHRGRTAEVRTVRVRGGSAANVAALTCERGGAARFVGQIGADTMGDALLADLQNRGVDMRVRREGFTGVTVCLRQEGYRTLLVDRGVAGDLPATDSDVLDRVSQVFVPGRSLLTDPLASVVEKILVEASGKRLPITMTGLNADDLPFYGRRAFRNFLTTFQIDTVIFTARDHAALGLTTNEPVAGPKFTLVMGAGRTTVLGPTEGGKFEVRHCRSAEVTEVVDRTGSDDAFVAGYLLSRVTGAVPSAAVDAAHRVAAMVLTQIGPTTLSVKDRRSSQDRTLPQDRITSQKRPLPQDRTVPQKRRSSPDRITSQDRPLSPDRTVPQKRRSSPDRITSQTRRSSTDRTQTH